MRTLIIPCGGKSSRFPNMRPKWLLTHPDGLLMIQKAIGCVNLDSFDRVVIVILQHHIDKYDADLIVNQAFKGNEKINLCVLPEPTASASETVVNAIRRMNITGSITIKDSDNLVDFVIPAANANAVVGLSLRPNVKIQNIQGKSFLRVNDQSLLIDIIEKKVVSDVICLGVYQFSDAGLFVSIYEELSKKVKGEMFISHIVSYALRNCNTPFEFVEANNFQDWGTFKEWRTVQQSMKTYFVDYDGVLIKNSGKYGKVNWDNNNQMLENNCKKLAELVRDGAQIVITTSRPECYRASILANLKKYDIRPYALIMGLNHAPRVLINDFAPTNPFPSATALSIPRNSELEGYLS